MFRSKGEWYMKLTDGREISFYQDSNATVSPFKRIEEFDGGDCWLVDIDANGFEEDDDGFKKVSKDLVERVYFKRYGRI